MQPVSADPLAPPAVGAERLAGPVEDPTTIIETMTLTPAGDARPSRWKAGLFVGAAGVAGILGGAVVGNVLTHHQRQEVVTSQSGADASSAANPAVTPAVTPAATAPVAAGDTPVVSGAFGGRHRPGGAVPGSGTSASAGGAGAVGSGPGGMQSSSGGS